MYEVNIFASYDQEENHFTNSLLSLLSLSKVDGPDFLKSFLKDRLGIDPPPEIHTFKVLQGMNGSTADAELSGPECCIHFETKIESGALRDDQIQRHLEKLKDHTGLKRLILLTPDDPASRFVDDHVSNDRERVRHLEWKSVYSFLERSLANHKSSVFSELVRQFLQRIRQRVFEQDIAGIILKIAFGKTTDVLQNKYLEEMERGEWTHWNTPGECKLLHGKGRKLILYDRTRQSLTVEVEIKGVEETKEEAGFPWTNEFVPGTVRILDPPIPLSQVRSLKGFEDFGVHRKDRSPYRKLTQEQYKELMVNYRVASTIP